MSEPNGVFFCPRCSERGAASLTCACNRSTTPSSDALREAAERHRVEVRALLRDAEQKVRALKAELRRLDLFLDNRDSAEMVGLRGSKIGRAAREILLREGPLHYKQVFELLTAEHEIAGRDPLASMLTAITRDPFIARVGGSRSGTYEALSSGRRPVGGSVNEPGAAPAAEEEA